MDLQSVRLIATVQEGKVRQPEENERTWYDMEEIQWMYIIEEEKLLLRWTFKIILAEVFFFSYENSRMHATSSLAKIIDYKGRDKILNSV